MLYRIVAKNLHTCTLEASKDGVRVRDVQVDLSSANLFSSARDDSASRSFVPVKENVLDAFSLIDKVNSTSPIVTALKKFRDTRLNDAVALLTVCPPPSMDISVFNQPNNHTTIRQALKTAISLIDKELPNFFDSEKQLGTFNWLKHGGNDPRLGFTVGDRKELSIDDAPAGDAILFNQSGHRALFSAASRTAFVLSGKKPSAATAFAALCNSGTLGPEMLELNEGAAVRHAAAKLIDAHNAAFTTPPSRRFTILQACASPMACIAVLLSPPVSAALDSLSSFTTIARVLAIGMLGIRCFTSSREALAMRHSLVRWQESPHNSRFGLAGIMNTFPTALIDHVVSRSAGNSLTVLGPRSGQEWQSIIPELYRADLTLLPGKMVHIGGEAVVAVSKETLNHETFSVTQEDDLSDFELQDWSPLYLNAQRLVVIERAADTWDTLHATSLLRECAQREGISLSRLSNPSLQGTLKVALEAFSNEREIYPGAVEPFEEITKHLGINTETWRQIARALNGYCLLMRLQDSRRAQSIAQEVFREFFPNRS